MIFARRDKIPSRVRVNKAGTVSLLSIVRHLGLPDNVYFDVTVNEGAILLTPTLEVPKENDN